MASAQLHTAVNAQVSDTLARANSTADVTGVTVNGDQVRIQVSDPALAPAPADFDSDLVDAIGPNVSVAIE